MRVRIRLAVWMCQCGVARLMLLERWPRECPACGHGQVVA